MIVTIDASPATQDRAAFGNELRAKTIEDAAAQATMQPWVAMECYQLSRGGRVSQMQTWTWETSGSYRSTSLQPYRS